MTGTRARPDRTAALVLWASVIAFVAIVLFGASGGIRGSDQYWYFDDTETLLRGDPAFTNCLYPRQLLVQGIEVSPIIHDILPQRAVIPIAKAIGPYWSWIAMNLAAMLLGAWLTFVAVRRVGDERIAACAASALLLLPLPVQGATQLLAESSIVPIFAALLVLLGRPGGFGKYAALAAVLTIAFMSRFTSIAFLLLLPIVPFTERASMPRRVALAAWCVALLAAGVLLNGMLFRGIPLPGSPIALQINGNGMNIWLTTDPIVLTIDSVIAKLALFVRSHAELSTAAKVVASINWALMLAGSIGAAMLWRRGERVLAAFVWAVVAVNVATLTLYQNQIRFVLPTFPVLLFGAAALAERAAAERPRLRTALALLLPAALLPIAIVVAIVARREGVREAPESARLVALAAELHGEGDVIHVGGNDQMFAHGMRPRAVLFVSSDQAAADWARIREMPRWRWITAAPGDLERLKSLGLEFEMVAGSEHRGAPLVVAEITNRGAPPRGATLSAPSP
ncbi:MAG: hypothetical protein FJ253_04800 [Phycisphaerae bacterium]|nr:hypothetical protein [Phycisphaerae bacterium]